MNTLLNDFGRQLIAHLVWLSVEMAIFAVVVFAVIYLFRIRSAKLRCLFWALVFIKPIISFGVMSPFTIYTLLQSYVDVSSVFINTFWNGEQHPVYPTGVESYVMVSSRLDTYGIVGLIWGMVVVILSIRLIAGRSMVLFLGQQSVPQKRGILFDALVLAKEQMPIRRDVVVRVSHFVQTPMQCGFWRPVILFPQNLMDVLTPEQMRLVMLHELAHVRRWDNAFLLFERVVEVFLFFHPAVWVCGRLLRREVENACDDAVLAVGENAVIYANSLVRVAEWREQLDSRYLMQAFINTDSGLARRVNRLLKGTRVQTTTLSWVLGIGVWVMVGVIGLPRGASEGDEQISLGYVDVEQEVR